MKQRKQQGVTLLELMIVIAILAILVTMAMPYYRDFLERQKIRSVLNEWQNSFFYAQSEAMRTKRTVTLCGSSNGINCDSQANVFTNGWIVSIGGAPNPVILKDNTQSYQEVGLDVNGNQFANNGIQFLSNGRVRNFATGTLRVFIKYPNQTRTDAEINNDPKTKTLTISSGGRLSGVKR